MPPLEVIKYGLKGKPSRNNESLEQKPFIGKAHYAYYINPSKIIIVMY